MTFIEIMSNKYGLVPTPKMLKSLNNFDPKAEYKGNANTPKLGPINHQILLGKVSSLVRDMMTANASEMELVRAIKYGAVILDTMRYNLNYMKAGMDFGISALRTKYSKH